VLVNVEPRVDVVEFECDGHPVAYLIHVVVRLGRDDRARDRQFRVPVLGGTPELLEVGR
jgi:hypothetical protein